jgi:hypothetical protein
MGACHNKGSATYITKGRNAGVGSGGDGNKEISLEEKLFDIRNSFDVFSMTSPKRGKHLKVGDELYSSDLANSKQRQDWKLEDGSKINVSQNVKITNIKEYPTTIEVTGKIKVGTRKGVSERTIKKRFNKNDRFMVADK